MIKATAQLKDGKHLLVIGLSFGNLDKFRAEPGNTFIRIKGEDVHLPVDVVMFSGETEAHLARSMEPLIGPHTVVYTDEKLKQ